MRKSMVKYLCPNCGKKFKDVPMGSAFMGKVSMCPSCGLRCDDKYRYVPNHYILRGLWRGTKFTVGSLATIAVCAAVLGTTPFSWAGVGLGGVVAGVMNNISARRKDRRASAKMHNEMEMKIQELQMAARQGVQRQPVTRRAYEDEVDEDDEEDDYEDEQGGFLPAQRSQSRPSQPRPYQRGVRFGADNEGGFTDDGGFLSEPAGFFGG